MQHIPSDQRNSSALSSAQQGFLQDFDLTCSHQPSQQLKNECELIPFTRMQDIKCPWTFLQLKVRTNIWVLASSRYVVCKFTSWHRCDGSVACSHVIGCFQEQLRNPLRITQRGGERQSAHKISLPKHYDSNWIWTLYQIFKKKKKKTTSSVLYCHILKSHILLILVSRLFCHICFRILPLVFSTENLPLIYFSG